MPIVDVPQDHWEEFLDGFSRQHRAWLASVEHECGGSTQAVRNAQPLVAVTPERESGQITAVQISFGLPSGVETIRVEHPATVQLLQTAEGADRSLEIVDEKGECTRLRFTATVLPEMLDGVAPAER